jgi:hypothetical protein
MKVLPEVTDLATRLELAQAQSLKTEVSNILAKEVEIAQRDFDSRVSASLAAQVRDAYQAAQTSFLQWRRNRPASEKSRILMAPTSRVVDFSVSATAVQILIQQLEDEGRADELRAAINTGGPASGGVWERAENPVQVVASIIRWSAIYRKIKGRVTSSGPAREWIFEALKKFYGSEDALKPRLGGISAANSVQGVALGDDVSMMALGTLPKEVAVRLPQTLRIIGDNEAWYSVNDIPQEEHFAGHFAILADQNEESLLPSHWESVTINGELCSREKVVSCDILVTGSSCKRDFGSMSNERLTALGASNDVVILTGAQYLTNEVSNKKYFDAVGVLDAAGACISLSYVEAKERKWEFNILADIKKLNAVDTYSANAGETYQLLLRLTESPTAVTVLDITAQQRETASRLARCGGLVSQKWHSEHENPAWLVEAAILLQEVLSIPLVRIRGRYSDITVVAAEVEISNHDDVVSDLIMSRVAAVFKVALPKGLLSSLEDITILRNIPKASSLAGLFEVVDFVTTSGFATGHESLIPTKLYTKLHDKRTCFVIPPLDMYIRDGGTTSAGDLMDYVFLSQQANKLCKTLRRR